MTSANTLSIVGPVQISRTDLRVLSGGKSSAGNDLGGERFERRASERTNNARAPQIVLSSHSGTTTSQIDDVPRLNAAFVAQALAQVMTPSGPDATSALAAYQRNHVRRGRGLLLDDTL
jgi:hypothetical protein